MRKDREARNWTLLAAALWVAGCSSGLPPEPSGTGGANARAGKGAAGSAGAIDMGQPAGGGVGPRMLSGRGEACPGGDVDCQAGLHCLESVRVCAAPGCVPSDESDCDSGDEGD